MSVSPARRAAFDILLRVERDAAYASELLHSERLSRLALPDRGLCMELVMGVLRWRSLLDDAIAGHSLTALQRLDAEVLTALRMGAYQLEFLERIPARAAIHESVALVKAARKASAAPLANAVLRRLAADKETRLGSTPSTAFTPSAALAHDYAHPPWLVERWITHYGLEKTAAICRYDQEVPAAALRLHGLRHEQRWSDAGIALAPGALVKSARRAAANCAAALNPSANSGRPVHPRQSEGAVASPLSGPAPIQDEGSQLVAALVGHGRRILDCCAAPGGKTAALTERNPAAKIMAADVHPHRARLLRRLVRAGNVQVIAANACALPLAGGFDRVLADVPCSGTGTLARNPEIKWRLRSEDLARLHDCQVAILRAALRQLAPQGRLVYSTCSLEPEENEAVVEAVLADAGPFRLRDCRAELQRLQDEGELLWPQIDSLLSGPFLRTLPGTHPCDGFFAAVLERIL
jgi:16S rRNA (cytosine967-C5)-methyltransferase